MEKEEINKGKIAYYDWKNSNEENDEWRPEIEKNNEAKYSFHSAELLEKMDQLGHTPPLQFYVNQNACYENSSFEDTDDESDSIATDNSNDVISIHFLETIFEETDDDIEEVDSESSEPSYGYGCFDNDDTGSVIYIPINNIEDKKISKEGLSSPGQVAKPQRRKSGQQLWSTSKDPAGIDSLSASEDINIQISGNDSRPILSEGTDGNEKLIKVDNKIESLATSTSSFRDNCEGKESSMLAEPETSRHRNDVLSTGNIPAQIFGSSCSNKTAEDLGNERNHNCSDQSQNYDKIWIRNDFTIKDMNVEAGFSDLSETTGIYEDYRFSEKSTEDDELIVVEGNETDLENNIYDKIWIDNSERGIPELLGPLQNGEVLIISKCDKTECPVDIDTLANEDILQHTNRDILQHTNKRHNSIISEFPEDSSSTFTCDTYDRNQGVETQEVKSLKIDMQNISGSSSSFISNFDSTLENAGVEYSECEYLNKSGNIPKADEQHELSPHLEHEYGIEMYSSDMDVSSCDESDNEDVNLTLRNSRCRVRSFASFDDLTTIGIEEEEEDTSKKRLSYSTMLSIVSEGTETEDDDKSPTVTNQLAPAEKCASIGQDYETVKLSLSSVSVVLTEHNVNEAWTDFKTENSILLPKSELNLLCYGSNCPSNIDRTYPCRSMPSLTEFKFYDGNPKEKPLTGIFANAPNSPLPVSELNPEEIKPFVRYPGPLLLEAGKDKCVLASSEKASSYSEDKQISVNPEIVKINNFVDDQLELNVIYNNDSLQELPTLSKSRLKVTDKEEELEFEPRLPKESVTFPESKINNKIYDFDVACNQDHLNCASSLLDSQLERCEDPSPNDILSTSLMLRSLILPDYEYTTSDKSDKFVHALPQNVSNWHIETDRPHVLLTTVNHPNPDFEEESLGVGTMPLINEETVSENLCSNQSKTIESKLDITADVCRDFADEENEIDIHKIHSLDLVTDTEQSNLLKNVIKKSGDGSIDDDFVPNRKSKVEEKYLDDIKAPTKNHLNVHDEQLIGVGESGKTMNTTTEQTIECNSELSKSLESHFKISTEKKNQAKCSFTKKHQNLTYYTKKYELLEVDLLDSVFETSSLSVNQPLTERDLAEICSTGEAAVKSSNFNSLITSTPLNVVSSQLINKLDAEEPEEIGNSKNGTVSPKHDFTLRNSPMIEQSVSSERSSPVDCIQLPPVVNAINIYHSDNFTDLDEKKILKKDVVKDKKRGDFDFTEITEIYERPNSPENTPFHLNVSTSRKSKAQKSKSPNKIHQPQKGFFERFSVGRLSKKDVLRKGKSLSDNDINKIKPVTYDKPEKHKFSFFNFGRHKKRNSTESQKSESPDSKLTSKTSKNSLFYSNTHSRDVVDFSKTKSLSSLSVDAVDIYASENFNVLRNITETISILKETPIDIGGKDRLHSNVLPLKNKCDDQSKEDLVKDTTSTSYAKSNLAHSPGNDQIYRNMSLAPTESCLVSNNLLEDIYTPSNINGTIKTLSESKEKSRQIIEHQKLNLSPSDNEEFLYNSELEVKVIPTNTTDGKLLECVPSESQNCSSNSPLILSYIGLSGEIDEENQIEGKIPSEVRTMSKYPIDEANYLVNNAEDRCHETKNQANTQQEKLRSVSPCSKEQFSRLEERISFPSKKNETLKHQKNYFSDTKEQNTKERVNFPRKEQKSFGETKKKTLNHQQMVFAKKQTHEETAPGENPSNFPRKEEQSYANTNIETSDHRLESPLNKKLYPLDNYLAYGCNAITNTSQDNLHSVKNNLSAFDVQQVKETKQNYGNSHSPGSNKLKEKASSSKRAFLETNLDENMGNCRNFLHHSYDIKAKSMLNLDGFAELPNPKQSLEQVELRAMSVEHLLDESRKSNLEAPENELQRTANQQPSEYEIKVQESLQKLNIPEWYKPNKFRIISPKSKSQPRWSNSQRCQTLLEKNNWQNVKGSRDTLSPSSTTSAFSYSNTSSNLLLDSKCVRFGSSRSIQSRSSNFSSERDDSNLMSLSSPSYCSERSTPLGRNILSVHKPYLGWRSRESLSAQNGYKTPAERLAESFQSKSHVDLQKSDVKSSIQELTSAIQDYVHSDPLNHHDKVNKNSPRKPKMWLESSFLGLSTLDFEEQDNIRDFIPEPSEEILLI